MSNAIRGWIMAGVTGFILTTGTSATVAQSRGADADLGEATQQARLGRVTFVTSRAGSLSYARQEACQATLD